LELALALIAFMDALKIEEAGDYRKADSAKPVFSPETNILRGGGPGARMTFFHLDNRE
jgi:hypothetical protein